MGVSVVGSSAMLAMFKCLLDSGIISKEDLIKNYWEMRKIIVPGASYMKTDQFILDKLGIADEVYQGGFYELGMVKATPDKELPLIISRLKTEEAKQEVERRLKSEGVSKNPFNRKDSCKCVKKP